MKTIFSNISFVFLKVTSNHYFWLFDFWKFFNFFFRITAIEKYFNLINRNKKKCENDQDIYEKNKKYSTKKVDNNKNIFFSCVLRISYLFINKSILNNNKSTQPRNKLKRLAYTLMNKNKLIYFIKKMNKVEQNRFHFRWN